LIQVPWFYLLQENPWDHLQTPVLPATHATDRETPVNGIPGTDLLWESLSKWITSPQNQDPGPEMLASPLHHPTVHPTGPIFWWFPPPVRCLWDRTEGGLNSRS
ncbi:hypothetical protein FQN60_011782, partial [Etheostoma spectabile]